MLLKNLVIRKGERRDIPAVFKLIQELALFEKAPESVKNTPQMMLEDAFCEPPVFHFFVAELEEKIVGTAIFYISYSTWKGKSLYLDDLVVQEQYRGTGIGTKLIQAFLKQASDWNVQMVHWQVLDWNKPAIEFYEKMGCNLDAEWINCKLFKGQF